MYPAESAVAHHQDVIAGVRAEAVVYIFSKPEFVTRTGIDAHGLAPYYRKLYA